jgi:hypothetical protein
VTTPEGKSLISGTIPRLRATYLGKATYHGNDATVAAQGLALSVGLCWSPSYDTRGLVWLLCGDYSLGFIQLKSSDAAGAITTNPSFQTVGVNLESEYHLGSLFHLALMLAVDEPLQTLAAPRVVSTLDTSANQGPVFRSSPVVGYGMIGVGVHF